MEKEEYTLLRGEAPLGSLIYFEVSSIGANAIKGSSVYWADYGFIYPALFEGDGQVGSPLSVMAVLSSLNYVEPTAAEMEGLDFDIADYMVTKFIIEASMD